MPNPILRVLFFISGIHKCIWFIFQGALCKFVPKIELKYERLVSIKKLVLNPTNAISTAGALCWPIFGGLNCQFRGICSNRELDCFNDFPICQWKSAGSKVTSVLTVRSPIFGGFGSCLAKVIHCRARTVLAAFRLKISKLHSVHFRGLTKTFQSFYFEFPISAAQQEPISRGCASLRR